MTNHAMPSRTEPAGWTAAHLAERDYLARLGIDVSDAHAEWLVITTLVEDVDGLPLTVAVRRIPVVTTRSGCQCGVTHYPRPVYADHDDPGDPGREEGQDRDG